MAAEGAEATADPPAWFRAAMEAPYHSSFTDVGGCLIHSLRWCAPKRTHSARGRAPQGVAFVHGTGAHAHWFTHLAPLLVDGGYEVLALSLSGHGESGERERYDEACWSDDCIGAMEDAGFFDANRDAPPVLVGHSLGSYPVIRVAQRIGARLGGIVCCDSGIPHPMIWMSEEGVAERRKQMQRPAPARVHPMSRPCRLTLSPPQRVRHQYIVDFISSKSWKPAKRDDGSDGWRWSFDPQRNAKSDFLASVQVGTPEAIKALRCRVGIVYGDDSAIVNPPTQRLMAHDLGEHVPLIGVADAEHHLFLDQPLAFVAVLKAMIGEWKRSATTLADGATVLPPLSPGRPSHSDFDEAADMAELRKGRMVFGKAPPKLTRPAGAAGGREPSSKL